MMNIEKFINRKNYNTEHTIYADMGNWCILCEQHGNYQEDKIVAFTSGGLVEEFPIGKRIFNKHKEICDECIVDLNIRTESYWKRK